MTALLRLQPYVYMYLLIGITHYILKNVTGFILGWEKVNHMIERDNWVSWEVIFEGLGVQISHRAG